ncbi:potassium transporter TrkA [Dactylosporangium sp. NPDC005555]|uniref:potassium transporter TrkA n=1 Tax=Dactylosporangium sp. NPDC005555 TaxID=3154889 RepID=UPI0033A1EDFE
MYRIPPRLRRSARPPGRAVRQGDTVHTVAPLPGVGMLHVLAAEEGRRVGVVQHDDDRRELVIYDPADPDTRLSGVLLTAAEARVIAGLVGVDEPPLHCARLDRHTSGVAVLQVLIGADGTPAERPLPDSVTAGASIAAVVRDDLVVLAPEPSFRCRPGDVVVVIGRPEAALAVIDTLTAA